MLNYNLVFNTRWIARRGKRDDTHQTHGSRNAGLHEKRRAVQHDQPHCRRRGGRRGAGAVHHRFRAAPQRIRSGRINRVRRFDDPAVYDVQRLSRAQARPWQARDAGV